MHVRYNWLCVCALFSITCVVMCSSGCVGCLCVCLFVRVCVRVRVRGIV